MKKRILTLALALIMIISLLPMTALAEDPAAKVTFNNNVAAKFSVTVNPGETAYVITDDSAQFAKWEDDGEPADKFIKLDYPADGAATLKVTFKNIEADVTSSAFHNYGISFAAGAYAVELTLIGDNKITHGTSSCMKYYNDGGMTITGDGSLSLTNTGATHGSIWADGGDLLIKNTNINTVVSQGNGSMHHAILATKGNVTLEGSKFVTTTDGGYQVFFGQAQKEGDKDGRYTLDPDENRKLVIKNCDITFTINIGKTAFKTKSPAVISNSTLVLTTKAAEGPLFSPAPTFEGDYTAIAGLAKNANKLDKLKEYSAKKLSSYTYIKIVPGKVDLLPTDATEAPTEAPTTEETEAPTTEATEAPTTEATKPVDATQPTTADKNEATKPADKDDNKTDDKGEEKSGSPLKVILIILIALVVLGGGAVAVILILRNKNAEEEDDEEEEEEEEEAEESEEETEE